MVFCHTQACSLLMDQQIAGAVPSLVSILLQALACCRHHRHLTKRTYHLSTPHPQHKHTHKHAQARALTWRASLIHHSHLNISSPVPATLPRTSARTCRASFISSTFFDCCFHQLSPSPTPRPNTPAPAAPPLSPAGSWPQRCTARSAAAPACAPATTQTRGACAPLAPVACSPPLPAGPWPGAALL